MFTYRPIKIFGEALVSLTFSFAKKSQKKVKFWSRKSHEKVLEKSRKSKKIREKSQV